MGDTLYVLAASYDDVGDALTEYEALEAAWRHVSSSHDFDATMVAKDEARKVQIVRRHDEPTRHGAASGLGWGLATGAVAALVPAVGILGALAVGGGAELHWGAVAVTRAGRWVATISRRSGKSCTGATQALSSSTRRRSPTACRPA
jgi:hypothetical protein